MEQRFLKAGIRPTKTRRNLLELLDQTRTPQTAQELSRRIRFPIHKVTLYRDLELFAESGLVEKVQFDERSVRYRAKTSRHSHHLICQSCGTIDEVELSGDLDAHERRIDRDKQFLVSTHSLEFYGQCRRCR